MQLSPGGHVSIPMVRTGLAQQGFENFPGQDSATPGREVSQVQELFLLPLQGLPSPYTLAPSWLLSV